MTATECIEQLLAHLPIDESSNIDRDAAIDTLLFAEIGEMIVRRFDELGDPAGLFSLIEEMVNGSNPELPSMVLTGLVEQLQSATDGRPDLWFRMAVFFGEKTSRHAVAMDTFWDINKVPSPSS